MFNPLHCFCVIEGSNSQGGGDVESPVYVPIEEDDDPPLLAVPNNFLVFYATTAGRYSMRLNMSGSRMEEAMRDVLENYNNKDTMDFLEFLTEVTGKVSEKDFNTDGKITKNVPQLVHKLTEPIVFHLKQNPQEQDLPKPFLQIQKQEMEK